MILEFLSVCSKSDLSELKYLLSKKIPTNHFVFINNRNKYSIIIFDKQYRKIFYNITTRWLNKKICRMKIEDVLKTCYLEYDEHLKIRQKLIEKTDFKLFYNVIWKKMSSIYRFNNQINLEGFITFGLKDYNNIVKESIISNLNEIITENYYEKFIALLKEYICSENSLINAMYIEVQPNGSCKFFDEKYKDITQDCINVIKTKFGEIEENDDLLLSILIFFLPNEIYLCKYNLIQNKNIIYTLKRIFGDRITFTKSPVNVN